MRIKFGLICTGLVISLAVGCTITSRSEETLVLVIGDACLSVEVVDTPEERSRGLMFRESLDWNSGMLFVYPGPRRMGFWMKNTYIPLSVAFIDEDKKIIAIYDMEPLRYDIVYSPPFPARYALEVNQGWFEANGVGVGDVVEF